MALNIYKVNPEFRDIMPKEIIDLEENATWAAKMELADLAFGII
jgi:hypothetical protein